MPPKLTKRLNNQNGNNKSYQDSLSPDQIKKKLEEYQQVDDIKEVPLNTHLRYFTFNPKTGKKQFRLGGFLSKIDEEYVILNNGEFSWSVQIDKTVFFKKVSFSDMKEELILEISKKYEKKIAKLVEENQNLKETIKKIKNQIKK